MWTSLLIVASIWGSDPDTIFAGDRLALPSTEIVSQEPSPGAAPTQQISPSNANGSSCNSSTPCGNTGSDGSWFPWMDFDFDSICEDPFIEHFIDEMNPFAPLKFETLANYYDPFGIQMGTGSHGPQSLRLGWSTFSGNSMLPAAHATGTAGSVKVFEWNSYAKYSQVIQPGILFNGTFWFNAHWWDGPSGIALPGQFDQTSSDLELAFFNNGPWSGQIAFHPQLVESYESRIDKNAFNFDGRAVVTYKDSPQWSFVGGVAVWDRVNTLIVPHVGAIWTPTNRLEIRALFPKSRVSYFLGNWRGADFWVYGQYEYSAQAWQSTISAPAEYSDRMQVTDQRLTSGLRWDSGRHSFYLDGGYVFDRQVKFAGATPSFDLADSVIVSFGVRY